MQDEVPYVSVLVLRNGGERVAEDDLPMPEMQFAKPVGTWVVTGFLLVVTVAMWVLVSSIFVMNTN